MKPNEGMFPRTIKEIEAYVGTNTTRNVAGLISHLETELLQYKADLRATDEQVAQLEEENAALKRDIDLYHKEARIVQKINNEIREENVTLATVSDDKSLIIKQRGREITRLRFLNASLRRENAALRRGIREIIATHYPVMYDEDKLGIALVALLTAEEQDDAISRSQNTQR